MGRDIVGIFTLAIIVTILADVIRNGKTVSTIIKNSTGAFAGLAKLARG